MIEDWDKAYANSASIANAQDFIDQWSADSAEFRNSVPSQLDIPYGSSDRQVFDLFHPDAVSKGLFVFVHGGYWYRFDKSYWSHFTAGPLALGWSVAVPSYTLTPKARVSEITQEVSRAISEASKKIDGPIILAGHSAGGHLVTRQVCSDTALAPEILARIVHVTSISGVHDLRPIMRLELNQTIGLDSAEALAESPALLRPVRDGINVNCVVGGEELPEFIRQNALLANIWEGLGASMSCHLIEGTHHFNVIDDLQNPDGLICGLIENA